MAGKITELATLAKADAAADDWLEVVDVSDTTMAASGTNKKFAFGDIGGSGGGGGMSVARVPGYGYKVANQKGVRGDTVANGQDTTVGRAWFVYLPGYGGTLEAVGVEVTNAGDAGAQIRFGIYACATGVVATITDLIGARLADSGQIAAGTTGFKSVTGLNVPVPASGLWLAWVGQSFTTAPGINNIDGGKGPGIDPSPQQNWGGINPWDMRGGALMTNGLAPVTGAFPATFPAGSIEHMAGGIGWLIPDLIVRYRV